MELSKLSKTELQALVAQMQAAQESGLMVKLNSSGGVFIRHNSFKAWSTSKNKEYTAGVNMPYGVAKALFGNAELLEQIAVQVKNLKPNS
jgi:hypothetical protein